MAGSWYRAALLWSRICYWKYRLISDNCLQTSVTLGSVYHSKNRIDLSDKEMFDWQSGTELVLKLFMILLLLLSSLLNLDIFHTCHDSTDCFGIKPLSLLLYDGLVVLICTWLSKKLMHDVQCKLDFQFIKKTLMDVKYWNAKRQYCIKE